MEQEDIALRVIKLFMALSEIMMAHPLIGPSIPYIKKGNYYESKKEQNCFDHNSRNEV